MLSTIFILPLLSAVMALPNPVPAPYKNMLVPNENGELVYATPEQIAEKMANRESHHKVSKRDDCDKRNAQNAKKQGCSEFCERAVSDIVGDPVKVSADINCDVATCAIAHAEATTITNSITISMGGTSGATADLISTFTGSVSYTWSKAEMTSDTYTMNPTKGDKGYIVFRPYLKKSCGLMLQFSEFQNTGPFPSGGCEGKPIAEDPNACGTMPKKLSSGKADGEFAFCNTNTKEGC